MATGGRALPAGNCSRHAQACRYSTRCQPTWHPGALSRLRSLCIQGRDYVEPDDVKLLAPHLLTHRLLTTTRTRMRGQRALEIMTEILAAMPAPVEMIAPPPGKR